MARSALVTGGSSGIGLSIAKMLKDEGLALTLVARRRDRLETAASDLEALAVLADVSVAEDCRRAVAEHIEQHGGLDVLVNSAGVGFAGAIDELPLSRIDVQLNVNLRGLMLVTAAALPSLRDSRGLIVNIASLAGTIPSPRLPVYGATKAAVIHFTNSLNRAEETRGVRAIAISPGFVDTPMSEWSPVPAERMIRPEDCAEIVRAALRLSPYARIPHVVVERLGS